MKNQEPELSQYAQFHIAHKGLEARYRGRPVCKAQAYALTNAKRGHLIDWLDKPGWNRGHLVDHTMYHHYLSRLYFL